MRENADSPALEGAHLVRAAADVVLPDILALDEAHFSIDFALTQTTEPPSDRWFRLLDTLDDQVAERPRDPVLLVAQRWVRNVEREHGQPVNLQTDACELRLGDDLAARAMFRWLRRRTRQLPVRLIVRSKGGEIEAAMCFANGHQYKRRFPAEAASPRVLGAGHELPLASMAALLADEARAIDARADDLLADQIRESVLDRLEECTHAARSAATYLLDVIDSGEASQPSTSPDASTSRRAPGGPGELNGAGLASTPSSADRKLRHRQS